jgi:hypothetical protein
MWYHSASGSPRRNAPILSRAPCDSAQTMCSCKRIILFNAGTHHAARMSGSAGSQLDPTRFRLGNNRHSSVHLTGSGQTRPFALQYCSRLSKLSVISHHLLGGCCADQRTSTSLTKISKTLRALFRTMEAKREPRAPSPRQQAPWEGGGRWSFQR